MTITINTHVMSVTISDSGTTLVMMMIMMWFMMSRAAGIVKCLLWWRMTIAIRCAYIITIRHSCMSIGIPLNTLQIRESTSLSEEVNEKVEVKQNKKKKKVFTWNRIKSKLLR